MARIHNRMPVILQDGQIETWLDPTVSGPGKLGELLKAPPEDFLDGYPVDPKLVNSGLMDAPECINNTGADDSHLLKTATV